jgi:hypothetical protein
VSIYAPGSTECDDESSVVGPRGYIVCFENHSIDLDLTIADLNGVNDTCLTYIRDPSKGFNTISRSLARCIIIPDTVEQIIVLICLGADIKHDPNFKRVIIAVAGKLSLMEPFEPSNWPLTPEEHHEVFKSYVLALKLLIEHSDISPDDFHKISYLNEAVTKLKKLGYM